VALPLMESANDELPAPISTPYGYHIVRIVERKAPPGFAESEKDLRSQYQQTRYSDDYENYVHHLKQLYRLNFDVGLRYHVVGSFDSTATADSSGWSDAIDSGVRSKTLFTYSDKSTTVQDLLNDLASRDEFRMMRLTPSNVEHIIDRLSTTAIVHQHALRAPDRHPALDDLMKEYEDGILLYRIEQDEIWKKVVVNDSLLRHHYQENATKFSWPHRVKFAEIFVQSEALAESLSARGRAGDDFGELAAKYTERPMYRQKRGEWGLQPYTLNELTAMLVVLPVDSVSPPLAFENGWSVVKVLAKERSRPKTYEEASAEVASSYQEYAARKREEEWIAELRKKYGVSVHNDVLSEAFKKARGDGVRD
jgi:peptidyl-prolyl cis-trans isomerase SurA